MLLIAAIIIGSLSGLGLLLYFFISTPAARLKRIVFWSAGIVSVGIFIFLLYRLSGSFLWSWVVFLIPLILRWRGLIQQIRRAAKTASGPAKGQVSSVNTEFLEMNLNHDTGEMSGLVKKGEKKGYRIETLNLNQLLELIEESKSDAASIQLLERFLDKYFDENWRETSQSSSDRYENNNDYSSDSISRAQALKILGLVEPVTDEQIKEAHRRLILANHPDRGGSTFLATQINKAKDVLLENVK
ncbi:MAG: hypothetical protein CMM39_05745 [Rhodospirillaceae bacterium]|nr:hypothetical protein [Rhodospirillaceae bacterium]MDG1273011.1 hypothetical protein [Alphaproteobacteria bacterium]|tara:strand:+ start:379 stop:1110 length:732 start_codon:yes stop_codon:yes gene_type:complete